MNENKIENPNTKMSIESFLTGILVGITIGLFLHTIIVHEFELPLKTKKLLLQQKIIYYLPTTGIIKIKPEYNTNNYYWYMEIPGVDINWWK